ncbi:MAG TPA: DUF4159 domain-containing protein [Gemmatimonadaceae bacterium]|nr:DUF4159 domain-containing protein [Gemmatimonadaceae bacterium]
MKTRAVVTGCSLVIALAAVSPMPLAAQQCGRGGFRNPGVQLPNAKYDGRYTFVRIAYNEVSAFGGRFGRREPNWHHDYPDADQHFPKLLANLSTIRAQTTATLITTLDNPDLFKFPVAYLVEAGHWLPSDREATGLRNYLRKGGFIIFDDLSDNSQTGNTDMDNLMAQLTRVLPGVRLVELAPDHPIFDSFYRVKELDYYHPYYCMKSQFYGIFVDNDPRKRMMGIVNYNNDVGEYWEWSDQGWFAVNPSNEAYKLGINYIIYALTR